MKKCCLLHTEQGPQTLLMMLSDWREHGARAAAGACVRVSVCVRLHYVHWWPDCDIIWTYLALFRCSAVFRLSGLLAPGNSLLLSAHYRDLMRRNHHQVHTSHSLHTSLLCLASIFNSTSHSHQHKWHMCMCRLYYAVFTCCPVPAAGAEVWWVMGWWGPPLSTLHQSGDSWALQNLYHSFFSSNFRHIFCSLKCIACYLEHAWSLAWIHAFVMHGFTCKKLSLMRFLLS